MAVKCTFIMTGLIRLSHYTYVKICLINIRLASTEVTVSAVQYSTVQCSAVQYSTAQCSAVQYSAVQCSTVQYSAVQYSTV